jgi:hypothetical protein
VSGRNLARGFKKRKNDGWICGRGLFFSLSLFFFLFFFVFLFPALIYLNIIKIFRACGLSFGVNKHSSNAQPNTSSLSSDPDLTAQLTRITALLLNEVVGLKTLSTLLDHSLLARHD